MARIWAEREFHKWVVDDRNDLAWLTGFYLMTSTAFMASHRPSQPGVMDIAPLFLKHCGIGHLKKTRLLPDLKPLQNAPKHFTLQTVQIS